MRLEATVPDNRGAAVLKLADQLGLSRSQLIDEALSLFMKAVVEIRRGRRLMMVDPQATEAACELATPTLSALEWALKPGTLDVSPQALERMAMLVKNPGEPNARLKAAAKRHRK